MIYEEQPSAFSKQHHLVQPTGQSNKNWAVYIWYYLVTCREKQLLHVYFSLKKLPSGLVLWYMMIYGSSNLANWQSIAHEQYIVDTLDLDPLKGETPHIPQTWNQVDLWVKDSLSLTWWGVLPIKSSIYRSPINQILTTFSLSLSLSLHRPSPAGLLTTYSRCFNQSLIIQPLRRSISPSDTTRRP